MSDDRAQSEFNMAVSYLNRLNALFYAADESAMSLDAGTWFHVLMALERELSTEMSPDELQDFAKQRTSLNQQLQRQNAQNARTGRAEIPPELYEGLHTYELQLRTILRSAGLQTKIVDDAMKALK